MRDLLTLVPEVEAEPCDAPSSCDDFYAVVRSLASYGRLPIYEGKFITVAYNYS